MKLKYTLISFIIALSGMATGQSLLSAPPSGGNQRGFVSQGIGIVTISVSYSSPGVRGREGKIWGSLVPYNDGQPMPWRAGANENTVITTTHDVKIQGQNLKAGSYGFHIIPSESDWTLIFSKNYQSWGSFSYDPNEDAIRVKSKPEKSDFHEWLTYEFTDRNRDYTVLELKWENLRLPIKIEVDEKAVMLASLRKELQGTPGNTTYEAWDKAAQYALSRKLTNNEEILKWVNTSILINPMYSNTMTKYKVLKEMGKDKEAKEAYDYALKLASNEDLYRYGRELINDKQPEKALTIFKMNKEKFGNVWPVSLGLGRGYEALGDHKNALKNYTLAIDEATNDAQKANAKRSIANLQEALSKK